MHSMVRAVSSFDLSHFFSIAASSDGEEPRLVRDRLSDHEEDDGSDGDGDGDLHARGAGPDSAASSPSLEEDDGPRRPPRRRRGGGGGRYGAGGGEGGEGGSDGGGSDPGAQQEQAVVLRNSGGRRGSRSWQGSDTEMVAKAKRMGYRKSLPTFAMRFFSQRKGSTSSDDASATSTASTSNTNETRSKSSGNLSSTKSAPATPVGERLQAGTAVVAATAPRSRRRATGTATVASSASTPTLVPLPSPAPSKARHKKFHRHFDSVAPDERVLNYYSCALVGDILLQGHLYITSNYFAFYSNVFGYVTKVLIPATAVLKVSKEKTARIIPNAIGVATLEEKHVFGSLLSRDNTYKLMVQVWKTALGPGLGAPAPPPLTRALPLPKELKDEADSASASGDVLQEDDDSSLSGDGGLPPVPLDKMPIVAATCNAGVRVGVGGASTAVIKATKAGSGPALHAGHSPGSGLGPGSLTGPLQGADGAMSRSSRQTLVLGVSTALVAFLLLSTAFLFHRISRIQDQFRIQSGDNLYQDLARWQNHLHARSASQVEEFLNTHLDQLAKVRKSLEVLTMLIVSHDDERMQQANVMHQSPYQDQNKQQTRPPSEEDSRNS